MRKALVCGVLLTLASTDAAAQKTTSSWFYGADPHVPLATVRNGKIHQAVPTADRGLRCGDTRRWAAVGSKWHALDAWGQILATTTVSSLDPYDVTACAEVSFAPHTRITHDDRRVFVSADSAWKPAPSVEWHPTATERASFEALVATALPARERVTSHCSSLATTTAYFDGRWAVAAKQGGWVVASRAPGRRPWKTVSIHREKVTRAFGGMCFRPVAIFDMDGDGVPEIILRSSEGASWGDEILKRGRDGLWRSVASSPGGATA